MGSNPPETATTTGFFPCFFIMGITSFSSSYFLSRSLPADRQALNIGNSAWIKNKAVCFLSSRQESNLHYKLRKLASYPLNDERCRTATLPISARFYYPLGRNRTCITSFGGRYPIH